MRVVFLVPWRSDRGHREQLWRVCRRRWEALFPDWAIYEGASPDGPFQRAAAINDAARQAGQWDMAVIIDADVMLSRANVQRAVERAAKTGKVTWAHRRWREVTREATERLIGPKGDKYAEGTLGPEGIESADLDRDRMDLIVSKTNALSWSCCIAIRRDAWDKVGGFDERFIGWGHEDGAFMAVTGAFVGWDRIEGDVINLWHDRTPGSGESDKIGRKSTPQALVNARYGMRYAVALRRDYGLTDRSDPSPADVLARDIQNYERMDEEWAISQGRQSEASRQAFDGWWPTLEELQEGAREHRRESHRPTVTVVVHTGGNPETWTERSAYLRQSLASLTEQLSGRIVQRVVYSDWGDDFRDELVAIAQPFGFYVAGEGHHGYTGSMQRLWKYLAKRAQGTYVFATEDDFTFERPVDLDVLGTALKDAPHLAQIALLRDPFYRDEQETGGILGWPEPAFTRVGSNGTARLEHRLFFTANPSLFRRSLTDTAWPDEARSRTLLGRRSDQSPNSEVAFGKLVMRDQALRFAFWGEGEIWVRHIGAVRAGSGY